MPLSRIDNPAGAGIITDVDPMELPDNGFSSGQNVRFGTRAIEKILGHQQVFGSASIVPYWLMPVETYTTAFWLYAGLTKVYVTDGTTHTNITRQTASVDVDYTADADKNWNGGIIGGIPVINNGNDDPQMWNPANTSTKLASLKWDASDTWSSVSWTCNIMRTFRNYLIAMDITKSGTRDSRLVAWSTSSPSNDVPPTWDKDDATEDAGEEPINQTNGDILDGLSLYDQFFIYKSDSVWGMSYIGGTLTFRIYPVFKDVGILATDCVAEFDGKHFVVTNGDVIIHNGQSKESVISDRRRNELFSSIDPTNFKKTYVAVNYPENEVWICYPSTGSTLPDSAMIYNWRNQTWSDRALPSAPFISFGIVDDSGEVKTWADTGTWDTDTTTWDETNYNPTDRKMVMAATNIFQLDSTTQFDGTNFTANVQRDSLFFGDPETIKQVNGLWIRSSGTGTLSISLGYQMNPDEAITWKSAQTFTVGTNKKIPYRISGRYISYKIESTGNADWKIHGIAFDVKPAGRR